MSGLQLKHPAFSLEQLAVQHYLSAKPDCLQLRLNQQLLLRRWQRLHPAPSFVVVDIHLLVVLALPDHYFSTRSACILDAMRSALPGQEGLLGRLRRRV